MIKVAIRRLLSIVLYGLGGTILTTQAIALFALDFVPWFLFEFLGPFLLVALLALGLGAWSSPGRTRLWEIGLVLLIVAGCAALMVAMIIFISVMPDTRELMPQDARSLFSSPVPGLVHLLVISVIGWLMMRQRASRQPDPQN